jgi:hypothetical protein
MPSAQFYNKQITGAPPAPRGMVIYNRRVALAMTSTTAPTGYALVCNFAGVNRPLVMPMATERMVGGGGGLLNVDDMACWSVSAILAFDALPGEVTGDIGVVIGSATRGTPRFSSVAGMEIGPSNTGVTSVFCRAVDGGPVTFNQVTPLQPDHTKWNKYEIRLISATDQGDARAKFFINDRLQFSIAWPGVLPSQAEVAPNSIGFTPCVINHAASAAGTSRMYCSTYGMCVCAAPNEAALL